MNKNVILTSERLIYRPYKIDDVDTLVKLCNEKTYYEVGFDIGEAYQNKGYATEATHEILKWAFSMLSEIGAAPKIVGKAEHKNYASRKVLEKSRFKLVKKTLFCHVYEICLP